MGDVSTLHPGKLFPRPWGRAHQPLEHPITTKLPGGLLPLKLL